MRQLLGHHLLLFARALSITIALLVNID